MTAPTNENQPEGTVVDPTLETILETMIDEDRIERIDTVLAGRLVGLTALLEDVHKPQNMSACMRTLEAIGIQNVHVIEGDEPFRPNPKITQGCHKWLDVHHHHGPTDAVAALKAAGYRVLATSLEAECTLDELDFSNKTALCFGNELHGISPELAASADETFRLPMYGFSQSFNLSVALGMCMQTAASARRRSIAAPSDMTNDERTELRKRYLRLGRKNSDAILRALAQR
ncbi:MAG: tRNA (guanosine-2'-O-)-methyltransferase [Myxococcota bacterium]|jgi:tRNA (guanosine-2'-O-)-methyltransferase